MNSKFTTMPIPGHFDSKKADQVYSIDYEAIVAAAYKWKQQHGIRAASTDGRSGKRIGFMPIDVQNTFCIPGYQLYVGGRGGRGAVDDSVRTAEFLYRNLVNITSVIPTMDTHRIWQVFHTASFVNDAGEHPAPFTMLSEADLVSGKWGVNPAWASAIGQQFTELKAYALHYVRSLAQAGRGPLTLWPYHAMIGGIGHALVSVVEEAIQFHSAARAARVNFQIKGGGDLSENYSILRPEVLVDQNGIGLPGLGKNKDLIDDLLKLDALIITGQARSHCVAWSIQDFLDELVATGNEDIAKKVYLLEDCSTSVFVPSFPDGKGGMTAEYDAEPTAAAAFAKFAAAGMNIVRSTDPMESWPGMAA